MRRLPPVLLALLGCSLLLNAVLLTKTSGTPAPPPVLRKPALDGSAEALGVERGRVAALERRIQELEIEKSILAQGPGALPSREERLAAVRGKIRRYLWSSSDPQGRSWMLTAEGQVEMNDIYTEFLRLVVGRTKDPEAYLDALRTFFVEGLQGLAAPLDPARTAAFDRVLAGIGARLRGLEGLTPLERLPKEIDATAGMRSEILAVLTPEQGGKLEDAMNSAGLWDSMNGHWVEREHAETAIVEEWARTYGLEEHQKPAALAAARAYTAALDRLNASFKDGDPTLYGSEAEAAGHRGKAARLLVDALESLRPSLTAEQERRLRSLSPREIRFVMRSEVLGGENPK